MKSLTHEFYMRRACELAEQGYSAPNPLVGCVIVRDGKIVGEGFHLMAGTPHAEIVALQQAGSKALGSTVYLTLEPCAHHGRTPPCADALIAAGVERVFVHQSDRTEAGGGNAKLREAGIKVEVNSFRVASPNTIWSKLAWQGFPFVTIKAAIALDGRMGPGIITNESSRCKGRQLRAQHGAVLVGAETALQDDPQLTVRDVILNEPPVRIILDPSRRLPDTLRVFTDGLAPTWRVVLETAAQEGDVAVPLANGSLDLEFLLQRIADEGIPGVLVEGGPVTQATFVRQGFVDRIDLFIAPKCTGQGPKWEPGLLQNLSLERHTKLEDDVWLQYAVGVQT